MGVRIQLRGFAMNKGLLLRLYSIGIPAALNMAMPSVLISALNGILAAYGQVYVLVLGVYYKLQTFLYLSANGIIQGIRPLVGYNYGVWYAFVISELLTAAAAGLIYRRVSHRTMKI